MSVAEFIELRERIEALAGQITVCVKDKNVEDSKKHLEEANQKLDRLKTMVSTDVQVIVADRLTRQLHGLTEKVETMAAKKPARKPPAKKRTVKKEIAKIPDSIHEYFEDTVGIDETYLGQFMLGVERQEKPMIRRCIHE